MIISLSAERRGFHANGRHWRTDVERNTATPPLERAPIHALKLRTLGANEQSSLFRAVETSAGAR